MRPCRNHAVGKAGVIVLRGHLLPLKSQRGRALSWLCRLHGYLLPDRLLGSGVIFAS